jgi:hypothetical protein
MSPRVARLVTRLAAGGLGVIACVGLLHAQAQGPSAAARGQGPVAAPTGTARQIAPVDLTGTWVSVVTEDWRWRMVTPPKGDFESVPLSDEGRRVLDQWTEAQDGRCEAYGVGGIMRMPGRVRINWQDDNTLTIETDAGAQTRFLRFGAGPAAGPRTPQGYSVAEWIIGGAGNLDVFTGRGDGPGRQRWGALRVRTAHLLPGWLRRNGVPYSQDAVITEHVTRFSHPQAGDWFVVTTTVDDPRYLTQTFTTSSNFRREPDDSKWSPAPCRSR